ncbi:MAG: Membrane protein YdfJ [Syntrophorhabdus sp. PtaU1.Bin058]|nr:MAG: Membrane protein YdfJ [Syntrophorhabdus sp. PtaU1.Bin058]
MADIMKQEDKKTLLDRLSWFLTRYRLIVLALILVITAAFFFGALKIKGEVIFTDMLPYDHPYLKLHETFSKIFGSGGSGVVIAVKTNNGDIFNEATLAKVKKITQEIELWDEVYRALTVSIASHSVKVVTAKSKGEISVAPLMFPDVPKNPEEMEVLKKNIFSNPAYNGTLVSKDGTGTIILTEFKENISYERAFQLLQKLKKDYADNQTSIHITGYPMLMGWIYSLKPQMYKIFGISVIGIAVILFLVFRNFLGIISPLVNAGILTIWGLGFIGFTGINFNPMLYVLAFLVGSRMIGNSVQITYRYFEELNISGNDRSRACYETMRTMFIPNFAAVATDAAGFLVLLLAKIVLMQHLAIIMTFWMMSIILTGFMVPVICTLIPLHVAGAVWDKERSRTGLVAGIMSKITNFSISPHGRYVVGAIIVVIAVVCTWQTSKLKIGDPTPGSPIFYDSHTYNRDQAMIDKTFDASSENLMLFYEGQKDSAYNPTVLNTFEGFERHIRKTLPDIYKSSTSIMDIMKMTNVTYHDGDKLWCQLPRNLTMSTGLMNMVKQNTPRGTFERFMDATGERAQTTLFFSDHTSENLLRIRDAAYDFFKTRPMKIDKGEFKLAGGRIGLEIALNEEMKRAHVIIDLTVLGAIFLLCMLSFRSVTAGLMLTLPLFLANSVAAAYMAWKGIGLSINTLPVAAIGVGVGVDFAIYLYSRCREEFPLQKGDWVATITQSICTCGKAVVYTGTTIILPILSWYIFSDMKFQSEVGFFLAMIMGTNVMLTLSLHPLMIYIIKPKFISRNLAVEEAVRETKEQQ